MAVVTIPNFPGGTTITIATWVYVPAAAILPANTLQGAGFDTFSSTVPIGGLNYKTNGVVNNLSGFSVSQNGGCGMIPLFEWGYQAGQTASLLYLVRTQGGICTNGTGLQNGTCTLSGPITTGALLRLSGTSYGVGALYDGSSLLQSASFATIALMSSKPWNTDAWNVLIASADVTTPDVVGVIGGRTLDVSTVAQHTKLWIEMNGAFDTPAGLNTLVLPANFAPSLPGGTPGSAGSYYSTYTAQDGNQMITANVPTAMQAGDFNVVCRNAWASNNYNYAELVFGPTYVFNKYIDPSQADVFLEVTESNGQQIATPAAEANVIAALGQPIILLDQLFQRNKGTGSPVVQVGTINPFRPLPSVIDV